MANERRKPDVAARSPAASLGAPRVVTSTQEFVFRRFHAITKGPLRRALARLPVVLVAFAADAVICLQANLALRRGVGIGYWRETAERSDKHAD